MAWAEIELQTPAHVPFNADHPCSAAPPSAKWLPRERSSSACGVLRIAHSDRSLPPRRSKGLADSPAPQRNFRPTKTTYDAPPTLHVGSGRSSSPSIRPRTICAKCAVSHTRHVRGGASINAANKNISQAAAAVHEETGRATAWFVLVSAVPEVPAPGLHRERLRHRRGNGKSKSA